MTTQPPLHPTLPAEGAVAEIVGVWTSVARSQADVAEIAQRQGRPLTTYAVTLVPFFSDPGEGRSDVA